jgi:hypothetical protein
MPAGVHHEHGLVGDEVVRDGGGRHRLARVCDDPAPNVDPAERCLHLHESWLVLVVGAQERRDRPRHRVFTVRRDEAIEGGESRLAVLV